MGISAIIASAVSAVGTAATAIGTTAASIGTAVGLPAGVTGAIGTGVTQGLEQGVLSAGISGLSGGNVGKGFASGFLSGGASGALGPALGSATGLGPKWGGALAGAGGGALGAWATGGDPLRGALTGAGSNLLPSVLGSLTGGGGAATGADATNLSTSDNASVGSGDLSAPVNSTLDGTVGKGAAAGGNLTSGLPSVSANPTSQVAGDTSYAPNPGALSGAPSPTLAPASPSTPGLGNIGGMVSKNPLAAVGILGALTAGNRNPAGYNQLQSEASSLHQQGAGMMNYLSSGTLPPGLQSSISAASLAAKATIRSRYAQMGMSGSSAEAQDMAGVDQRAVAQSAEIAMKLYEEGLQATQLSDQLYANLMQVQIANDQQLSGAIGNLSGALAMMGQPLQQAA